MAETKVPSELNATVWKIEAPAGTAVEEGDVLLILESMKMEIPVVAPRAGSVVRIAVVEGQVVVEGETLAVLAG